VASDGGVFAFGSAAFYGSMSGKPLDAPVVGIAPTPTGAGYWEVAADGGVFAFGSAAFSGSMGGKTLDAPVEGIAASATPAGSGYWEAAADGGVFAFGSAAFSGSMSGSPLDAPVVGVATASPVPLDETPIGDIAHSGRWLTDASGRVVLLHGVNVVAKTVPYYPSAAGFDAADAAWLEENGLRVVRLGVMATGLMPTPGKITQGYIADLAATVRTLEAHHIYVLLDMHQDGYGPKVGSDGFPAWMTLTEGKPNTNDRFPTYYYEDPATQQAFQSLWDNAKGPNGVGLQTDVADMFGALAQAFHSTQNVLGYDVFNEPWPGTTWESCGAGPAGCPNLDSSELDPLYAKVDRAIRSVTRSHTVFVEPFVLFNDGNVQTTVALPGGDPDSGLSFHQYATTAPKATHALDVLKNAITWSSKTGGALLNTEWGDTTTSASITTQADQFDQEMLPWIFWSYCCEVVRTLGSPPAGSNLITSTADALVRPYPLVVAGTPTSYGYEATDRTFTASWSTTEPDGRRAPAGAISTMVVPQRDYPGGYTVNVTGGQVTSKPCATVLAISTEAGTSSARVTVTPGAC
jgi:endoglycosylceramidase